MKNGMLTFEDWPLFQRILTFAAGESLDGDEAAAGSDVMPNMAELHNASAKLPGPPSWFSGLQPPCRRPRQLQPWTRRLVDFLSAAGQSGWDARATALSEHGRRGGATGNGV
jgi:hypothetical protein